MGKKSKIMYCVHDESDPDVLKNIECKEKKKVLEKDEATPK